MSLIFFIEICLIYCLLDKLQFPLFYLINSQTETHYCQRVWFHSVWACWAKTGIYRNKYTEQAYDWNGRKILVTWTLLMWLNVQISKSQKEWVLTRGRSRISISSISPLPLNAAVEQNQTTKLHKVSFSHGWTTHAKWKPGCLEHSCVTPDLEQSLLAQQSWVMW